MIDTIGLITQDFEYNSLVNSVSDYPLNNSFYSVKNGNENIQPELITDCTGKKFYGSSLNLKGNPIRNTGILSIDGYGLSFACSLPKFLRKENFHLATQLDLITAKKAIEMQLDEIGIKLNIDNCKLFRLDLTKNVKTDYKFYEYISLLQKLNFKRDRKQQYNAETYLIGNNSRQVCNYDKVAELLNNKEKLPYGISDTDNIFRCECRLLNNKTICRMFNLEDVRYSNLYDMYDSLHDFRKKIIKDKMFQWEKFPEEKYSTLNYDSLFKSSINNPENNNVGKVVDDFISTCTLGAAAACINDISNNVGKLLELVEEDCINKGLSRRQISVKKDKYKNQFSIKIGNLLRKMKRIANGNNTIAIADLYNELYEKLYIA